MIDRTVCFLLQDEPRSHVVLGIKKKGFGEGKYLGFGGKFDQQLDKAIEDTAVRELQEEAGITAAISQLEKAGVVIFHFPANPTWDQRVHVYRIKQWSGTPTESDEMKPVVVATTEVPYNSMWEDARYWLPLVLEGRTIDAEFTYQADNQHLDVFTITAHL